MNSIKTTIVSSVFAVIILFGAATAAGQDGAQQQQNTLRDVERLYVGGLKWLKKHQQPNGTFAGGGRDTYATQPGVVGLAVVAMLAHGDDPNFGPYAKNIKQGVNFILSQQNPSTGYIGTSMYNHGFATLALAEAYGAVLDPERKVAKGLTNAVKLIINAQKPNKRHKSRQYRGGWRYSPESSDSDSTVSGAQFVALMAAVNAGIPVPKEVTDEALKYLERCQSPADGGIGYTSAGGSNGPRTAIGALAFALAKKKDKQPFKQAMNYLYTNEGRGASSHYYHYFLYYASQAYFHGDPKGWQRWNARNVATLKEQVQTDGSWQSNFGPTFATASSLLSMALNYRYLPIYEKDDD